MSLGDGVGVGVVRRVLSIVTPSFLGYNINESQI